MRTLTPLFVAAVAAVAAFAACATPAEPPTGAADPARAPDPRPTQIDWQRSLEDALALQAATGRSILVAVNTDAESASERIVREIYRDPSFVARTREFICLIASPFRHTPRDHDGDGRRVLDPRLGAVTSGEAVALEPQVFERFLGGERIAPRHALVRPDGSKAFDLFQLYDFWEIDRALAEASEGARCEGPLELLALEPNGEPSWSTFAAARSNLARTHFEEHLAVLDASELPEVLAAIARHGDAGSLEALRVVLASDASREPALHGEIARTARALGLGGPLAFVLWAQLLEVDEPGLAGRLREGESVLGGEAVLLPLLGELGRDLAGMEPGGLVADPETSTRGLRSFLMSHWVLGDGVERELARRGLETLMGAEEFARLEQATAEPARGFSALALLRDAARDLEFTPPPPGPVEEPADLEALAAELERTERARTSDPDDAELALGQARAALALARAFLAGGQGGADLLLEDALSLFERAAAADPGGVTLRLEAARAAFLLSRFEEQERYALEVLALVDGGAPLEEGLDRTDTRHEASRWAGDAAARLLLARFGGEPGPELEGMLRAARMLGRVALGPEADETDWVSLTSFLGAIGRRRLEYGFVLEGLRRFPGSQPLRATLGALSRAAGLPELETRVSLELAGERPDSAACAWYAGYAELLAGEWARRGERPADALESYAAADEWFQRSIELEPSYAENATHYRALCALGSGFAHLLAGERALAADELVRGIELRPEVEGVRDGLDREALDLLDGALEWRGEGPSPVLPLRLAERLSSLVPGSALWMRSVSDSELREALRAAGRGEEDAVVEQYLDASIEAGRRALLLEDGPEERKALAQALTVLAERRLEGSEGSPGLAQLLSEAAPLQGLEPLPEDAAREALEALAARLREVLGEARPVTRPGR